MAEKNKQTNESFIFKDHMKKEDFILFVKKRKECNARAKNIVEQLLDTVTENEFLNVLKYLNQAYLDDVFEERFILKICGYPICDSILVSIPKHKYKISTAVNKVYDITTRKKFCSAQCFTASKYIREQLPSSPLWVLENEEERNYKLWNHSKSSLNGDEVKLKFDNIKQNEIDKQNKIDKQNAMLNKPNTSSINNTKFITNKSDINADSKSKISIDSTLDNLGNVSDAINEIEVKDNLLNLPIPEASNKFSSSSAPLNNMLHQKERNEINLNKQNDNILKISVSEELKLSNEDLKKPNMEKIDKIIHKKNIDKSDLIEKTMSKNKSMSPPVSVLDVIKSTFRSWITVDTIILLFGEEKVKTYCTSIGRQLKANTDNTLSSKQLEQYAKLCKKLDLMEIQEQETDEYKDKSLQPLPDYESLKQENQKLMIKVRAFYEGKTDIPVGELNTNESNISSEKDIDKEIFLPLTDQYNQKIKRRGIVLTFLDPIIAKLLLECNMNMNITLELRQLVDSFELDARNIIFKPAFQKFIALFILKLLSMLPSLSYKLNEIFSLKFFAQILKAYNTNLSEFHATVDELTNMENVIRIKNN